MTDDCVILSPIDTINTFTTIADYARQRFNTNLDMYGTNHTKQVITKTKNSVGDVIDLSSVFSVIKIMLFDRFKSDQLIKSGVSRNVESTSSFSKNIRGYIDSQTVVEVGDFILVNYDSGTGSFDEKYRILEKEAHEVAACIVFYTLYMVKEAV